MWPRPNTEWRTRPRMNRGENKTAPVQPNLALPCIIYYINVWPAIISRSCLVESHIWALAAEGKPLRVCSHVRFAKSDKYLLEDGANPHGANLMAFPCGQKSMQFFFPVHVSSEWPNKQSRQRSMGPMPFRGPMTTNQNNIDLILKENYNQSYLDCFREIEKNLSTEKTKTFYIKDSIEKILY